MVKLHKYYTNNYITDLKLWLISETRYTSVFQGPNELQVALQISQLGP